VTKGAREWLEAAGIVAGLIFGIPLVIAMALAISTLFNLTGGGNARVLKARADLAVFAAAARQYRHDTGSWPAALDDLLQGEHSYIDWRPQVLIDPWGHPYGLRPAADGVEISCRCAHTDGGAPDDDMIMRVAK
jgi:hypothetical protein